MGRCGPGSGPVSRAVRWSFRTTAGVVAWDWTHGPPDVTSLKSIRSPASTEKSRHIPVQAFCTTVGHSLRLESGLEHDLLMFLDRRPEMSWFVSQPARLLFTLPGRKRTVHTPDLLAVGPGAVVTIWDVRPQARQDIRFMQVSEVTAAAAEEVGWRYEVFAGLPTVLRHNLRWLVAYRMPMPWYDAARPVLARPAQRGRVDDRPGDGG